MPKPTSISGDKNLISQRLIDLRKQYVLSQRALAEKLQFQFINFLKHQGII